MKQIINYFTGFEWILLFGMILANYITGGLADPIGATCSITGVICVILIAKGKPINFFFGVINVILYIYICWQVPLYGDVMLNALYYLPINIFGYFIWKRNMNNGVVKAKTLAPEKRFWVVMGSFAGIAVYGTMLNTMGGATPFLDATSTVLAIVAQFLLLNMFAEQWVLWIIINSISVLMWLIVTVTGDTTAISMVIMWTAYLINSLRGYFNWKAMVTENK